MNKEETIEEKREAIRIALSNLILLPYEEKVKVIKGEDKE